MSGETDLATLLASVEPRLNDGRYVFVSRLGDVPEHDIRAAVVVVREREGTTLVIDAPAEHGHGGTYAWITLTVHSSLDAVGLTAAVSTALADHGVACNVVAGWFHDHLFVPSDRAGEAMSILTALVNG